MLYQIDYVGVKGQGYPSYPSSQFIHPGTIEPDGAKKLFKLLFKKKPTDLAEFVDALDKMYFSPSSWQNQYWTAVGDLTQGAGVSPQPDQLAESNGQMSFEFTVPRLTPAFLPTATFPADAIQIAVFSDQWQLVCICGNGDNNDGTNGKPVYFHSTASIIFDGKDDTPGKGTLQIPPPAWTAIVNGHGTYWVVEAKSYSTFLSGSSPVYFWSMRRSSPCLQSKQRGIRSATEKRPF